MDKIRGVNLGGWLVLEKWITPSLFEGLNALDETEFCLELGDSAGEVLKKHRKTYIIEEDFRWLSQNNTNAVRLPVPYWAFGDIDPYIGCIDYIDFALDMALKYGLKVLLDVHTAPGSQNGWDHSGKAGPILWHTDQKNIQTSINFLKRLANRYKDHPALFGIEVLNEPHWTIPINILKDYYNEAYKGIRAECKDDVFVVFSDSFRPLSWYFFMKNKAFKNVVLDLHHYQCFDDFMKCWTVDQHAKLLKQFGNMVWFFQRSFNTIIGEWSLGLDPLSFHDLEEVSAQKRFGMDQLKNYSKSGGWFFWTYKTEDLGGWNFRHCIESNILNLQIE